MNSGGSDTVVFNPFFRFHVIVVIGMKIALCRLSRRAVRGGRRGNTLLGQDKNPKFADRQSECHRTMSRLLLPGSKRLTATPSSSLYPLTSENDARNTVPTCRLIEQFESLGRAPPEIAFDLGLELVAPIFADMIRFRQTARPLGPRRTTKHHSWTYFSLLRSQTDSPRRGDLLRERLQTDEPKLSRTWTSRNFV
jgi:hypothetical protein